MAGWSRRRGFRDLSIRQKLTVILTLTSCSILLLACVALLVYDVLSYRDYMARDISTVAEVLGANSTAAIVFNDAVAAGEVLQGLRTKPHVVDGVIFDASGQVLAEYHHGEARNVPPVIGPEGHRFEAGNLHLFKEIRLDDERIGTIYVRSGTGQLVERLKSAAAGVSILLIASTVLALLISQRLQRIISSPILRLAEVANAVAVDKDYSRRAERANADELGLLTSAFNEMLDGIQERDRALREAHEELRTLVDHRTRQLQQEVSDRQEAEEALRQSEEQLRQSQKMEAIGRLAGGVAHDFNNLLTAITGYSELMLLRLKEGDPLRSNAEEIKRASDRAAALVRQLLAFSRKQVLEPRTLNLNTIVGGLEKMLKRMIGEDIALHSSLREDLGSVKADPGQIEQVIMNLVVNARDAMPDGGRLTIETGNVQLPPSYVDRHVGAQSGPQVLLAISDTGCGMDEATKSRIFEPFFTTKEAGRGTGLGLSTVYGIVKQSGGSIWVYSEPGEGTTFKVYLPRVDEKAEVEQPQAAAEPVQRGSETILLVEDEELVRQLAQDILRMNGYRTLVAPHGGEALLISEQHKGRIDLMLTDIVMPHINGRELFERLAPQRPDMKVLYMSGYTDSAIVHHGILDSGTAFIQKPFAPAALLSKVREVLEGRSRS